MLSTPKFYGRTVIFLFCRTFERVSVDYGAGYSLFGGIKGESLAHREVITRRAGEGWRYAGFVPVVQRSTGDVEEIGLVFERE